MQTLAITGAAGFLGRHLVSECLTQNRFNLRLLAFDRSEVDLLPNDGATVCEGNLLKPESLGDFLLPDCTLIHLAYLGNNPAANIEAARNVIELAKRTGIKRLVHCSTAVVVGNRARGVVTEEAAPDPCDEYQDTKLRIEEILRAELTSNVELAILRPTEIIGPRGQGLLGMIERLRADGPYKRFIYHCLLKNRRFNYVSVHNVVAALIFLASIPNPQNCEIYNISDDDDDDNNYAAVENIICSNMDRKQGYRFDVGLPRSLLACIFKLMPNSSSPDLIYSCDKITSLGYKRAVTLRSAISEIVSAQNCIGNIQ